MSPREYRFTGKYLALLVAAFLPLSFSTAARAATPPDVAELLARMEQDCTPVRDIFPQGIGYPGVRAIATAPDVVDTQSFLERLARTPGYSRLLASYVLVHTSRSSQSGAASRRYPRIIFFGGDLLMGVTGDPDPAKRGVTNRVEVIELDRANDRFHFHLIDFNRPDRVVEAPTTCRNCHGGPPRAIWPTYRLWPGSFVHEKAYDRQLAAPREGIYRLLQPTGYGESAAKLNTFLNGFNFGRIARELQGSADFGRYRYAAAAALMACPDLPSFLGDGRAAHDLALGRSLASLEIETELVAIENFEARLRYAREIGDEVAALERDDNDRGDAYRMAGLRYLFEGRGVPVRHFSLNFAPEADGYGYGFNEIAYAAGGIRNLLCRLVPSMVRDEPELAPLALLRLGYASDATGETAPCEVLRARSRRAFRLVGQVR